MLSKTSKQVVNACVELAKLNDNQYEGAASIAKRINAPQNYLGKMLQNLANQGLVISQKGSGGGFRLAKPSSKITLFDIVEPIENVSIWSECALGLKKCSDNNPCAVHHKWKEIREVYYHFLINTSIYDLLPQTALVGKSA